MKGVNMQVDTCIREMAAGKGVSLRSISAALEKTTTWTANVSAAGRSPALATVADIADVLGYEVTICDRATGVRVGVIEPPRQSASAD